MAGPHHEDDTRWVHVGQTLPLEMPLPHSQQLQLQSLKQGQLGTTLYRNHCCKSGQVGVVPCPVAPSSVWVPDSIFYGDTYQQGF